MPDVHSINRHGSFDVSASRLAFIDGSSDPWLYACPHSPNAAHGGVRGDTLRRPFKLIEGVRLLPSSRAIADCRRGCIIGTRTGQTTSRARSGRSMPRRWNSCSAG